MKKPKQPKQPKQPKSKPLKPQTALVRKEPESGKALAKALEKLTEDAREFMFDSVAPNTRRAYKADWKTFTEFCDVLKVPALPASTKTMVLYVTHLASMGKKVSTIERAKAAISVAHETAHAENPTHASEVIRTMKGIRNKLGTAPTKKKPILGEDMAKIVAQANQDGSLRGARDAALLSLGFAGGFRRSELVAIEVEHLRFETLDNGTEGVAVFIPKSKTDQEGKGRWIGIPHAPTVKLLRAWLERADINSGPVFRGVNAVNPAAGQQAISPNRALTADAVAGIVKRYAVLLGLDPKKYAGHSLRRGFITTTVRQGKNERDIMKQTGHRSTEVFRGYIEDASVFVNNAAEDLWSEKPKGTNK